ncbi:hypothetical protein J21TS7_53590 [Paenibacillus cineris]|uniref:Uncharacterized protein n=1 Tax=Paenibacillus cineris TaxID=237530 RepID=A0ABQ4LKJ3_9BACL|nr:hypothetical protein J21TS7_53590 [Paenibacillus cineris]
MFSISLFVYPLAKNLEIIYYIFINLNIKINSDQVWQVVNAMRGLKSESTEEVSNHAADDRDPPHYRIREQRPGQR